MARKTLYLVGEPLDIVTLYEATLKIVLRFKDGEQRKDLSEGSAVFTAWTTDVNNPSVVCSSESTDASNKITLQSSLADEIIDEMVIFQDYLETSRPALMPSSYFYRLNFTTDQTDTFVLNGKLIVLDALIDTSQYATDFDNSGSPSTIVINDNIIVVNLGDVASEVELARQHAITAGEKVDECQAILEEFQAEATQIGYLGTYNTATNTPTLSATPNPALQDGSYYVITNPGNIGFAGSNFTSGTNVNNGDQFKKIGVQWSLIRFAVSDGSITEEKFVDSLKDSFLNYNNRIENIEEVFSIKKQVGVVADSQTFAAAANNFHAWAFGHIFTEKTTVKGLGLYLENLNASHKIVLKVYQRLTSNNGATATAGPGEIGTDVLVLTQDFLTSLYTNTANKQYCLLDLNDFIVNANSFYIFQIEAFLVDNTKSIVGIGYSNTANLGTNPYMRGWYRNNAVSVATAIASPNYISRTIETDRISLDATDAKIQANVDRLNAIDVALSYEKILQEFGQTDVWLGSQVPFWKWAFGVQLTENLFLARLIAKLENVTYNDTITLKIYTRLLSNVNSTTIAGGLGTDVLVLTKVYTASTLASSTALQDVTLDFDDIVATTGFLYLFEISAQKTVDNVVSNGILGSGRTTIGSDLPQYLKGWYNSTSSVSSLVAITRKIIGKKVSLDQFTEKFNELNLYVPYDLYDYFELNASANANVVDFSTTKRFTAGIESSLVGSTTIPASTTVTGASMTNKTLNYVADSRAVFASLQLAVAGNVRCKNVSNVVVRRTSDNAVLVAGTDYRLHPTEGKLSGIISGIATQQVYITFEYTLERLDVLQANLQTNAITRVAGTERANDAVEELYRAKTTNGNIPLYYVVVRGTSLSLIKAHGWEGLFRRGRESELVRCVDFGKRNLLKTIKKLLAGQAVKFAGYGDSVTAQQANNPALTANGVNRDRIDYHANYPDDFLATIQKYDLGDGAGTTHTRLGWNWYLKAFLEKKYSSAVTYNNLGIGSSTSANTLVGSVYNGLHPSRIAELLSDAPDLCILGFGMNEIGSTSTYANIVSIIQQGQAVGIEFIVMGCPRINNSGGVATFANWRYTNNMLKQAALDTNSAFVPVNYFTEDEGLGFMGMDKESLCITNLYNHPGVLELKRYGEMLTMFF